MFDWLKDISKRQKNSEKGDMDGIPYKGYLIRPAPTQIVKVYGSDLPLEVRRREGKWVLELYVRKNIGDDFAERHFSASNTYKSRREAIRHCIEYGKQIIDDGKVTDL